MLSEASSSKENVVVAAGEGDDVDNRHGAEGNDEKGKDATSTALNDFSHRTGGEERRPRRVV